MLRKLPRKRYLLGMTCIFCKIASGEAPSEILFENDQVIAIRDIVPQAPFHALVMPKEHVKDLTELVDNALAGTLLDAARMVAQQAGLEPAGYRVATNIGEHGCQTVAHLHFHVLGGAPLRAALA